MLRVSETQLYMYLYICINCWFGVTTIGDEGGMALIGQIGELNADNKAVTSGEIGVISGG